MAMIHCPECGKDISDKALVCPNCGYPLNDNISGTNLSLKRKMPGRGFAISGLVLGILGLIYSPLTVFAALEDTTATVTSNAVMGIYVAIFGILALVFGFSARKRGYKKGKTVAAISMGFISVAICLASIILGILL